MKRDYYISAALLAAAMGLCSGCALLEKLDKSPKHVVQGSEGSVKADRTHVTSDDAASGPVLAPPKSSDVAKGRKTQSSAVSGGKAVKNRKKKHADKESGVSKAELAEARREASDNEATDVVVIGEEASKKNLTVENGLPDDFSIGGEWTVYSVRGNVVTGEERPYITFDLAAKRFYGSNGCNIINGDVIAEGKGELRLENIIATMKMCDDAPYEYLINLAVSDVKSYSARQDGPITYLDLKSGSGQTLLVLRRHNMDFLNGAWRVTSMNGIPVSGQDDVTMTIDIPDMRIHGSTGCNIFNGELFIDPDKKRSMQFLNIATTRMMCSPESRETEFLLGLESVETARSTGTDKIIMSGADGNEIFEMSRINYDDAAN